MTKKNIRNKKKKKKTAKNCELCEQMQNVRIVQYRTPLEKADEIAELFLNGDPYYVEEMYSLVFKNKRMSMDEVLNCISRKETASGSQLSVSPDFTVADQNVNEGWKDKCHDAFCNTIYRDMEAYLIFTEILDSISYYWKCTNPIEAVDTVYSFAEAYSLKADSDCDFCLKGNQNSEKFRNFLSFMSFDISLHSSYMDNFSIGDEADEDTERYLRMKESLKKVLGYAIATYYTAHRMKKKDYLDKASNKDGMLIYTMLDEYIDDRTDALYRMLSSLKDEQTAKANAQMEKKASQIVGSAMKRFEGVSSSNADSSRFDSIYDLARSKLFQLETSAKYAGFQSKEILDSSLSRLAAEYSKATEALDGIGNADSEAVLKGCNDKKPGCDEENGELGESCDQSLSDTSSCCSAAFANSGHDSLRDLNHVDNSMTFCNSSGIMTIGKFCVYKEGSVANTIGPENVACLVSEGDKGNLSAIQDIINRIGYDKTKAYLLKNPGMTIKELKNTIDTDRSLRYEYSRVLEDIESYFKSTFTLYLSNKYDRKYRIVNSCSSEDAHCQDKSLSKCNDGFFYSRGFLSKEFFNDYDEHYDSVSQLNETIDNEIRHNNQQVMEEYRRFRYSIPFSTAAGIMPFGWILMMFRNLNNKDQSEYLFKYFHDISSRTFCSWMNSLVILRNRVSHHQILYRISSAQELKPIVTMDFDCDKYDNGIDHSSLFYYTLIMIRIAPSIEDSEDFIDNLDMVFRKARRKNFSFNSDMDYSFPEQWIAILEEEKGKRVLHEV